jgi:aryl-alcohol dehydrogenase-like predicted oxidoreductase
LKKLETIGFLTDNRPGATIGQMALKFLLADPIVMTALPNTYNEEQLVEFAAAPHCSDITPDEMARLDELAAANFGVEEPAMEFKGVAEDSEEARILLAG